MLMVWKKVQQSYIKSSTALVDRNRRLFFDRQASRPVVLAYNKMYSDLSTQTVDNYS